jgi:hypothetical protein
VKVWIACPEALERPSWHPKFADKKFVLFFVKPADKCIRRCEFQGQPTAAGVWTWRRLDCRILSCHHLCELRASIAEIAVLEGIELPVNFDLVLEYTDKTKEHRSHRHSRGSPGIMLREVPGAVEALMGGGLLGCADLPDEWEDIDEEQGEE